MQFQPPPKEVALAGLRAMKTIAMADGTLKPIERELMDAVQRHLLKTDFDVNALETIAPAEVAKAVSSPEYRQRLLYGCTLMALIDSEIDEQDSEHLKRLAAALDVEDRTLGTIEKYVQGHTTLFWWDTARRFIGGVRIEKELKEKGLLHAVAIVRDLRRRGEDADLLAKYAPIGNLPPGTLGREYYEFVRRNNFGLPGEKGAAPELVLFHDCTHVLAGYGTDPLDETLISGFHAGTHGADPFGMLLFAVMQMHLGVQISPGNEGYTGYFRPDLVLEAFERGTRVKGDMMADWNPYPELHRSVNELRLEWGIPPRAATQSAS